MSSPVMGPSTVGRTEVSTYTLYSRPERGFESNLSLLYLAKVQKNGEEVILRLVNVHNQESWKDVKRIASNRLLVGVEEKKEGLNLIVHQDTQENFSRKRVVAWVEVDGKIEKIGPIAMTSSKDDESYTGLLS